METEALGERSRGSRGLWKDGASQQGREALGKDRKAWQRSDCEGKGGSGRKEQAKSPMGLEGAEFHILLGAI